MYQLAKNVKINGFATFGIHHVNEDFPDMHNSPFLSIKFPRINIDLKIT